MNKNYLNRRKFLQSVGLGAAVSGLGLSTPKVVGQTDRGVLVESESEYGGFLVEKLSKGYFPYECDLEVLRRI